MKLHFNVTKATVEKAMADLSVGERAMLFEDDFSVVSARAFLSRFLCAEDLSPIPPSVARRTINALSRKDFDEAIQHVADRMTDVMVPPDSAGSS